MTIDLDEQLYRALFAEGSRTYETPAAVAKKVLRRTLPAYLAEKVGQDLSTSSESAEAREAVS